MVSLWWQVEQFAEQATRLPADREALAVTLRGP